MFWLGHSAQEATLDVWMSSFLHVCVKESREFYIKYQVYVVFLSIHKALEWKSAPSFLNASLKTAYKLTYHTICYYREL